MPRCRNRFWPWSAFATMAFCVFILPVFAVAQPLSFAALLEQTESVRTTDHSQFLSLLKELHQQASGMSARERWQLRYLDAWQASFQNDYANADPMLRDIIGHSGDPALVAKASAEFSDPEYGRGPVYGRNRRGTQQLSTKAAPSTRYKPL